MLSKTNQYLFFLFKKKAIDPTCTYYQNQRTQQQLLHPSHLENRQTTTKLLQRPKKFSDLGMQQNSHYKTRQIFLLSLLFPPAKNIKLHRSYYQSSKSNYIVVHDPVTPKKDAYNCFTNTIILHTKNSLNIYN